MTYIKYLLLTKRGINVKMYKKIEINKNDFNSLFNNKCDVCAVCNELPWSVIDIDIKTRKVRDLLCQRCKNFLVTFNDDPQMMQRAADFLENEKQDTHARTKRQTTDNR
ncbi:MAG: hypothetical protein EPO02_12805 [Nitrospirae bacterium]|nr:MAG: hypothetical protein EPO02_12805 [Nitrospirota bacterium]